MSINTILRLKIRDFVYFGSFLPDFLLKQYLDKPKNFTPPAHFPPFKLYCLDFIIYLNYP